MDEHEKLFKAMDNITRKIREKDTGKIFEIRNGVINFLNEARQDNHVIVYLNKYGPLIQEMGLEYVLNQFNIDFLDWKGASDNSNYNNENNGSVRNMLWGSKESLTIKECKPDVQCEIIIDNALVKDFEYDGYAGNQWQLRQGVRSWMAMHNKNAFLDQKFDLDSIISVYRWKHNVKRRMGWQVISESKYLNKISVIMNKDYYEIPRVIYYPTATIHLRRRNDQSNEFLKRFNELYQCKICFSYCCKPGKCSNYNRIWDGRKEEANRNGVSKNKAMKRGCHCGQKGGHALYDRCDRAKYCIFCKSDKHSSHKNIHCPLVQAIIILSMVFKWYFIHNKKINKNLNKLNENDGIVLNGPWVADTAAIASGFWAETDDHRLNSEIRSVWHRMIEEFDGIKDFVIEYRNNPQKYQGILAKSIDISNKINNNNENNSIDNDNNCNRIRETKKRKKKRKPNPKMRQKVRFNDDEENNNE